MSAWGVAERFAREEYNLSDDYSLEMASVEVSDIDLGYRDAIFDRCEDDIGFGSSPEMIMEILDKHTTYIRLPAGMFLVKMAAVDQPDVWGFIQQGIEEKNDVG